MTKTPILLSALSAVCAVVVVTACGGDEEAVAEAVVRPVRYVTVSTGETSLQRSFSGSIRAGNQSRLAFQVTGRVEDLLVKVGDRVTKGQKIAALNPADFELQLQEARASAAQARAQTVSANATYERTRALYESNNASRQDLDTARANRDSAQSSSAAAGQAVRQLQRQLGYATLTAPGEGTISEVDIEASEVVSAGQVVAVLQVGEQLEVAVDVPESAVNRIEQGQEALITVSSLAGQRFTGTIYEIGVPMGGATVFPVTVRLAEATPELRAGMTAEVAFELAEAEEEPVMRVPATAVGEDREGRYVFVIERTEGDRGILHRAAVEVGGIENSGIEIRSGLEEGQLVVTAGVARVQDGLEVVVPSAEGEPAEDGDEGSEGDGEGGEATPPSEDSETEAEEPASP
ncbi:MAG: efflux RND transporter periplasmic adaptor subunit [Myxococcota bacterium]